MRLGLPAWSAAVLVIALAMPVDAQATTQNLFLLSDGTLSPDTTGAPAACITLSPSGGQSDSQTFAGNLGNGSLDIQAQTIVLTLQVGPGATSGTGFRVDGGLSIDGLAALTATKSYGQGAAVDSPITLAFTVPQTLPSEGKLTLDVTLTKTGGAPVLGTQSVSILCNDSDSRLAVAFTPADAVVPGADEPGSGGGNGPSKLNVILIAIGAGIVTLVAGLLVLVGKSISPRRLHLFLGLTAGLLMAIAITDLIPEAIEAGGEGVAITIALSLLVLYLIKSLAGEHSHGDEGDEHHHEGEGHGHSEVASHSASFAAVAFFALLIHRLVDGLALPGAFAAGDAVGFAASTAILVHQFPDGLAAASVFLAAGWPRGRVIGTVAILALATPVGSLVGLAIASFESLLPYLLGIAAATFLFIALAELLPELRARKYRGVVVGGVILGYVAAAIIELIAHGLGVEV